MTPVLNTRGWHYQVVKIKGIENVSFLMTQFLCNVDSPGHVMNSNVYRFPLFLVHHLKLLEIGNWKV